MNTIRKYRPIIVMEVWSNHYQGTSIEYTRYTFKDLLSIGYTVVHVAGPDYLFIPI
jgi:hypothetical protein